MASLNGPRVVNVAAAEKGEIIRLMGRASLGTNLQLGPAAAVQLLLEPHKLSVVVVQALVSKGSHCSHQAPGAVLAFRADDGARTATCAGSTLAAENGAVVQGQGVPVLSTDIGEGLLRA